MQSGQVVFTAMDRVIFGQAAAGAVAGEAERLGAAFTYVAASMLLSLGACALGLWLTKGLSL